MMNSGSKGKKRQRASKDTKGRTLRKRSKRSFTEPSTQESEEAQAWWSVQTVLAERRRPGRPTEYKVLWEPNPETGETYPPSWEPAEHLTDALLVEWRQKSRKSPDEADGEPHSQAAFAPAADHSVTSVSTPTQATSATPSDKVRRRSRVIRDSSDRESRASSAAPSPRHALPNPEQHLDPATTTITGSVTENGEPQQRNAILADAVYITQKTDFPRDDYLAGLSQAQQSQLWSSPERIDNRATPESQPHLQPASANTRLVIPDSQSQGIIGLDYTSPVDHSSDNPEQLEQSSSLRTGTSSGHDPKSSAPVLETDPIEPTSPVFEPSPALRSITQSPVKSSVRSPRRTASPSQIPPRPNSPLDGSRPLIGPGSLRSASKTPSRSFQFTATSPKPSPLRVSRVPSPNQPTSDSSLSHQEIFQSWGTIADRPLVSSHDFAEFLQSTHQGDAEKKDPPSSSIPDPPSQDPETLASNIPPQPETSSMPGTRRSMRASGAPNTEPSNGVQAATGSSTAVDGSKNSRGNRSKLAGTSRRKGLTSNPHGEEEMKDADRSDRESDLDDRGGTGLNSSAESIADGELQSQAISADQQHEIEPVMDHDAEGNSRLAARIPGDADDEPTEPGGAVPPETRLEAPAGDSADDSSTESDDSEEPGPSLGQMEFIVPLPFAGQARDQYRKTIKYNEELIEKFTGRKWTEPPSLLSDAQAFIQTMRNITMHIDLTNETAMTQTDIEPADVIEWDRSVSTKFKLLYFLLSALRETNMHVVIVSQLGKALDILENFLKGMAITYARADRPNVVDESQSQSQSQKPLMVTILPLGQEDDTQDSDASSALASVSSTRLVLAFDHLSDVVKNSLQKARQDPIHPERLAPLISLAVINSIDHIEHSIAPMFKDPQRLRIMVNCLTKLRKEAGRDDIGLPSIEESAQEIAQFVLLTRADEDWPLPSIGMLNNNDAWDLSQGLVSMKSSASSDSEKSAKAKAAAKKPAKRPLERIQDEEGVESSKKMRMTPQPEQEISRTVVSDTTAEQSAETQRNLTNDLNAVTELLRATEQQLQISTEASSKRIQALEMDIGELQFRFEEQTAEKRIFAKELSETKLQLEIAGRQRESRDATIDKLKDELRSLKSQLSEAHTALEGSQIPELAAMEKLRQEKEQAENARRRAERDAEAQESTVGYARQQLEEARSRATELQEQNQEYEGRIRLLEKQATGEISKARQLFLDERAKSESAENLRLKQENRNLQQLLQRKEEELKSRRSGMGTRAGSVPRSPRVGPASRAGSPIPDRRIGALKNNMMQGRRQSKPKQQSQHEDSSDGSKIVSSSTPVIAEPKPRSGRPIEMKALEAKHIDTKGPDAKSAEQLAPVPRPADIRTSANNSRPFPCVFAQYNCGSAFTSKNEWKRHISTKHIQLGFWRCDMCPPSPGIDHPVYNDFNRKDLFTQHLRRMHAMNAPQTLQDGGASSQPLPPSSSSPPNLTEEQITEIQKRCYRQLRAPPEISSCVFCPRTFSGLNSWEERLEHVGGHLERDRKNGTTCLDVTSWRPDPQLRDYLVTEGLVEIDPRGGYRIGDGKPKRPLDIEGFAGQAPTAQLTPRATVTQDSLAASPAGVKDGHPMDIDDSESSNGKRRRGRPPKRLSDAMDLDNTPASAPPAPQPPTSQPMQSPPASQQFGPPPPSQHGSHSQPGHTLPAPGHPNHQLPPAQQNLHGHPAHQGQPQYHSQPHPLQSPREGGPPPYPGPGAPPMSPRQFHLPPANLQNMYKFEHGSFTKFPGTSTQQWPPIRPGAEFGPQGLSARTHGQPQLAPKPAPDPVQEIMSRIYANAPQLAPKPLVQIPHEQAARDPISPRPPSQGGPPQQFHSGFRPINETPRQSGPVPVAPKPLQQQAERQEGGRQLAPKPPSTIPGSYQPYSREHHPSSQPQPPPPPPPQLQHQPQHHPQHQPPPSSEPMTPQAPASQPPHPLQQGPGPQLAPAPSPSSHPPSHSPPGPTTPKQVGTGAEMDDRQQSSRGRSFRDIVMS